MRLIVYQNVGATIGKRESSDMAYVMVVQTSPDLCVNGLSGFNCSFFFLYKYRFFFF
jgi:hypothetical protein